MRRGSEEEREREGETRRGIRNGDVMPI